MTATDFQVIVRSAGERTADVCANLLRRLLGDSHVYLVRSDSLEEALAKMCAAGLEGGRPWTISVDADVLVHRELLSRISDNLFDDTRLFHINGIVVDKFSMCIRNAGVRVYRTSYLNQCMRAIPTLGTCLRPETEMVQTVERHGLRSGTCRSVLGIHDYEQSFGDLVRKAMLHAKKHKGWSGLIPQWLERSKNDIDYAVTAMSFFDGLLADSLVPRSRKAVEQVLNATLERIGVREKPCLDERFDGLEYVDAVVSSEAWPVADFVNRQWDTQFGRGHWRSIRSPFRFMRNRYTQWRRD